MTFTFLTLPLSTNQLYAHTGRRRFATDRAKANKEAIGWEARSQYHGKPLDVPLAVTVDLYWPDRRKHDVDNIKVLLDACTGILWEDDNLIADLHIRKHYDKNNPRVEMEMPQL